MLNTKFSALKQKCLRRAGNHYNANDSTLLTIAGGIINDVLSSLQVQFQETPYVLDLANTKNTVANQAYVALTETDILEILQVYQLETDTKLQQISRQDYVKILPDSTEFTGVPELAWFPSQVVTDGQSTWSIYLVPTPSAVQAIYYDYIKTIRFATDDATSDNLYCALPNTYDDWIIAEFQPRFVQFIDPANANRFNIARSEADRVGAIFKTQLNTRMGRITQPEMYGSSQPKGIQVQDTPDPT